MFGQFLKLPYFNKSSINLKRKLEKIDSKVKIAFSNVNVLRDIVFSRVKDRIPKEKRSGVVYKIPCLGCSGVYLGETEQHLEKRISLHRYDLNHLEKESTARGST